MIFITFNTSIDTLLFQCIADITNAGEISLKVEVTLVSWYDNNFYALSDKTLLVYDKDFQQVESGKIEIDQLEDAYGMTNIGEPTSLIISDRGRKCLLRIMIPAKSVFATPIMGTPAGISTTPLDDVVVVVKNARGGHSLEKYRAKLSSLELVKEFEIPGKLDFAWHAVQTTSDSFIISCRNGNEYFLLEVSIDSVAKILRRYDTASSGIELNSICMPSQLAIAENDGIVLIHSGPNATVKYLNPLWLEDDLPVIIPNDLEDPVSVCYVREKHMLIVSQKFAIRVFIC